MNHSSDQHNNKHFYDYRDKTTLVVGDLPARGKKKAIIALFLCLATWLVMFGIVWTPIAPIFGLAMGIASIILCIGAQKDGYVSELLQIIYMLACVGALMNLIVFLALFDETLEMMANARGNAQNSFNP